MKKTKTKPGGDTDASGKLSVWQNLKDIAVEAVKAAGMGLVVGVTVGAGVAAAVFVAGPVVGITAVSAFGVAVALSASGGIDSPAKPGSFWRKLGKALPFVTGLSVAVPVYQHLLHDLERSRAAVPAQVTPQFNGAVQASGVDCTAPEIKALLKKYPAAACTP